MEAIIFVLACAIALSGMVLGVLTLACIKGTTWGFVAGTRKVPENVKWRYRVRHYRIAMNRLIGIKIFLPIMLLCIFVATQILLNVGWMDIILLGVVISISGFLVIVFMVYAVPKILNGIFYKKFALTDGENADDCSGRSKNMYPD